MKDLKELRDQIDVIDRQTRICSFLSVFCFSFSKCFTSLPIVDINNQKGHLLLYNYVTPQTYERRCP